MFHHPVKLKFPKCKFTKGLTKMPKHAVTGDRILLGRESNRTIKKGTSLLKAIALRSAFGLASAAVFYQKIGGSCNSDGSRCLNKQ